VTFSSLGGRIVEERSTGELIDALGEDCDRCHREILKSFDEAQLNSDGTLDADYEFHARQFLRALFAYIEGVMFSVKCTAAAKCMKNGIEISPQERYLVVEVDYDLNDDGVVVERPAKIKLTRNLRFAFELTERANQIPRQFAPGLEWWFCLRESIKVRDRLTHPRMPSDLDISPDELIKAIKAKNGFGDLLARYIKLGAA
jgi:hypothetical protein